MRKKIFCTIMMLFVILITFTDVHATEGLFHLGTYNDIYKLSEQGDGIDLPFINLFANAATYDKTINHSGITFGDSTIDVNEKLEGMHILVSTDMITIKGEVENAFIYGNNVVVEGKIAGDSIILSPNVQILEKAIVEKDVIIVANNLDIKGTINGNVIATVSEKTSISGTIENDLRMITQDVTFNTNNVKGEIYLETNAETTAIKERFPNAVIKSLVVEEQVTVDWMGIVTKGIVTVVIYSVICFLVTRKDNNIISKACNKFKEHTAYGLVVSVILIVLVILLPILMLLLALVGLGVVAWPVLIGYLSLILLVGTTSMLIIGMALYDSLKNKVGKFKIPVIALIYIVLYVLTKITYISLYVKMAMLLIAFAIVITMLTRKSINTENKEE